MSHISFKQQPKALLIITLIFLIASCSDSSEPTPSNEIRDESGLNIDLEWSTGGSFAQSISDLDLDLVLLKGSTKVDQSLSYSSFEQVALSDIYADGTYIVQVKVESASKPSDYKVFIKGILSNTSKQYDGKISTSEEGSVIEFITITKEGTKYTLSR
jgi:predicted transcriptional regulator with HTH domain